MTTNDAKLNIVEVFSSIQGEGAYVGCRQVFVRLAGCNLNCFYCDTSLSQQSIPSYSLESQAGHQNFSKGPNPISGEKLAFHINGLLRAPHHSVSITGGEPLCQAEDLKKVLPLIHGKIFLETNGTLAKQLDILLPSIDIISMDIKLPSMMGREYWSEHEEFLRLANSKEVYLKMVVSSATTNTEFMRAVDLINRVNNKNLLVLQPITTAEDKQRISPERLYELQAMALNVLPNVRVIPQTHKYIGVL